MDNDTLKKILKKHKLWIKTDAKEGQYADLQGAHLQYADLQGAHLAKTDLRGTNLAGADLRMADLTKTNLRGTNLEGADLRMADLTKTNLQGADLRMADLTGADLTGANLDYSCWPLWCGSLNAKVDKKIAAQLAYHFCRLDCDDPEYIAARSAILDFANRFHRVNECGRLEPIEAPSEG